METVNIRDKRNLHIHYVVLLMQLTLHIISFFFILKHTLIKFIQNNFDIILYNLLNKSVN